MAMIMITVMMLRIMIKIMMRTSFYKCIYINAVEISIRIIPIFIPGPPTQLWQQQQEQARLLIVSFTNPLAAG